MKLGISMPTNKASARTEANRPNFLHILLEVVENLPCVEKTHAHQKWAATTEVSKKTLVS